MTSHALAKQLLQLPDVEVVGADGCCGVVTFNRARYFKKQPDRTIDEGAWVHLMGQVGELVYLDDKD